MSWTAEEWARHNHSEIVPCVKLCPAFLHPPVTDPSARQDRLDALTDWERELLLAYLDGRHDVAGLIDEWFERRAGNRLVRPVLPGGYTSPLGLDHPRHRASAMPLWTNPPRTALSARGPTGRRGAAPTACATRGGYGARR